MKILVSLFPWRMTDTFLGPSGVRIASSIGSLSPDGGEGWK